jgi:hypothetical protein
LRSLPEPLLESVLLVRTGSQSRKFGVEIASVAEVEAGVKGKARSGEAGKPGGRPWLWTMSAGPSWSHDRQKWMHREKTENRRDKQYTEVVWDPDTGEIIHKCEEPLRDHQGHGSARPRD